MAYSLDLRLLDILHNALQQCRSLLETDLLFLARDANPKTRKVYSNALNEVNFLAADLSNLQSLEYEDFKHLILMIHCEVIWINEIYRLSFGKRSSLALPSMAYLLDLTWTSDPAEHESELTPASDDVTIKNADSGESSSLVEEEESCLLPSTLPSIDNSPDLGSKQIRTSLQFSLGSSHSATATNSSSPVIPSQVYALDCSAHGDRNGFGSSTNPLLADYDLVTTPRNRPPAPQSHSLSTTKQVFNVWSPHSLRNGAPIQSGTDPPPATPHKESLYRSCYSLLSCNQHTTLVADTALHRLLATIEPPEPPDPAML